MDDYLKSAILRTIEIRRYHILVSVHILLRVVSRRLIVLAVFIISGVRRIRPAILLTMRLGLAGSTLQLVKLSEDVLIHGRRPLTCGMPRSEFVAV
jgi:hypothetical protein